MDSNYMFLCGVMWCKFEQQEAGKELLRAAKAGDQDMSALAWAMLAKGARYLGDLERRARTNRRVVMAKVIEFYVPKNFRKPLKWAPELHCGKILEFCSQTKKSA